MVLKYMSHCSYMYMYEAHAYKFHGVLPCYSHRPLQGKIKVFVKLHAVLTMSRGTEQFVDDVKVEHSLVTARALEQRVGQKTEQC